MWASLSGAGNADSIRGVPSDATGADRARAISGRTSIPVIVFPDGTHVVEPSDDELRARVAALAL